VDLTESYRDVLPEGILERYEVTEIRNVATLFKATDADEFGDVVTVLQGFSLSREDVLDPGGSKSDGGAGHCTVPAA